jgi:diguanylate cyclase (GGDEF)-like protein/PAS domain S-box-containing protein
MKNRSAVEILVVEDNAVQAKVLRRKLVRQGYQVAVAENGAQALAKVRKTKPALVISDIVMPIMDGYQMCHEIKHDDELKDIPVILLTELSDPKDIIKGLDARADYYVTKPYDDKLLMARIRVILSDTSGHPDNCRPAELAIADDGETHLITAGRQEILNFLISTYENAVEQNHKLVAAQNRLRILNQELDIKLAQLQESEERFRILVQMLPDIVYRIDQEGRFTFINDAIRRLGFQPQDLMGRHFSEIILPADVEGVSREQVLPHYKGKHTGPAGAPKLFDERRTGARTTKDLEIRLVSREPGKINPAVAASAGPKVAIVEVNSSGMYEVVPETMPKAAAGSRGKGAEKPRVVRFTGTVGAIRDITPRKLAEASLQRSEARFRSLVQTAGNLIVLLSPNSVILEWNHQAERVCGKPRDAALGQNFLTLFDPGAPRDLVAQSLAQVRSGTQIKDLETSFRHQDGGSGIVLWNFNGLLDENQEPWGIIAVGQDVTEWKRAEEEKMKARTEAELARVSARIATETIDGMMDAVVILNPQGKIIQYNRGLMESFGWGREALGEDLGQYVVGVDIQNVLAEIGAGRLGNHHLKNLDCQIITRDQRKVPVLINATLQKDIAGHPAKIIAVMRDITERKHNEEELQKRNAEMSMLYQIASTIAGCMEVEEISARLANLIAEIEMLNIFKVEALFTLENDRMKLISHPQHSPEFLELHRDMKIGDCLCGLAAQTGEIVVSPNCLQDSRHTFRCDESGEHGHLNLPLKVMNRVTGVLSLLCAPNFVVDENKKKILQTIGGQIGIALDNAALHAKTRELSLSDPLTGIPNRRFLDIMLGKGLARANRYREPLAVVMADIDHFKKFNDTHGHIEGDKLLTQVAAFIANGIRQTDMVARYGGEEFLIMLPDAKREDACLIAERIRREIEARTCVTISLGVATYHPEKDSKEDLIQKADQALYRAKQSGRNQVKVMDHDHEP